MKKILKSTIVSLVALLSVNGCNYLDIVPDNIMQLEDIFETKEKTYSALADCYSYMPNIYKVHTGTALLGDEWIERFDATVAENRGYCIGNKIMRGWNNTTNSLLCYWTGGQGGTHTYEALRMCNIFIDYLESDFHIIDLSEVERKNWIAQIKVLKAYYHYFIIRLYGPIIINDVNVTPMDDLETVRRRRQPVEDCFQYVLGLLDEVLYNEDGSDRYELQTVTPAIFYGQVNRVIAKALKAKILITRASPLFNGNSEYYSNFVNENGEHYFPQQYDPEKWREAYEACEEAIALAHEQGHKLYEYTDKYRSFDIDDVEESEIMKSCYNLRFAITEPWNDELIWGHTGPCDGSNLNLHNTSAIRYQPVNSNEFTHQWLGTSLDVVERFYTKNGVPVDEDKTYYEESERFDMVKIPSDTYHLGYMQPGETTVKMHLNREPRFYAWIAVDRCIWRTWDLRLDIKLRSGEFPGGRMSDNHPTDYFWTGIGVKKYVHPESRGYVASRTIQYPYPLIRLADLYLLAAEAYNEYYGPGQVAYDYLNKIRRRAGLPDVEQVWSDATIVNTVGKHTTKEGLREIIQHERLLELSFESQSYYDILRWKRADEFYTRPVRGWNAPDGKTADSFYQVITWQPRTFTTPKDYLMPIPYNEMLKNPNMIQNPGWI